MDDGAAALFEMFPDLPDQTLTSVWRNCGGDFSAAVDEALTISSLDNFNAEAQSGASAVPEPEGHPPRTPRQVEELRWEDASSLLPAPTEETGHSYPPASPRHGGGAAAATGHGGRPINAESPSNPFSSAALPESGSQKLPWESTERYVIGSGELGLLNELQMPRRGSIVSLSPGFLRVPPPPPSAAAAAAAAAADGMEEAPPCVEPLIHLNGVGNDDEDDGSVEPVHLSPIVRPGHDTAAAAAALRDRQAGGGSEEERLGWRHPLSVPSSATPSAKPSAKPLARPSIKPASATFTPPRALAELSFGGAETTQTSRRGGGGTGWGTRDDEDDDNDDGGWGRGRAGRGGAGEGETQELSRRRAERARRDLNRERAAAVVGSADARPPLGDEQPRREGSPAAVRNVETASSADRIAAYRPGTRFHVAVDKGAIGLGITVKDICGRFFVYKLQALADGSPGSAEEAGVQEGDELLGVEELDFESERWDMDQLVSYMGELMGVVILHMMRGDGPLPQAAVNDVENGMSHGVAQTEEWGAAAAAAGEEAWQRGGDSGGSGSRDSYGAERGQGRARRLLEVLQEEELLKPSEAADISTLYCQISDRARQWDTGELWLSVAGMAHRPSREVIAAMAHRWQPGESMRWDESDSSGGEPSPASGAAKKRGSYEGREDDDDDDDDHPADLERIGTALLGHPLFSDPLSVVGGQGAKPGSAPAGRRSPAQAGENREENGPCWSPWPQLVALESKAARRRTVVPTQGIRKALNVRVLGPTPPPPSAAGSDRPNGASRSSGGGVGGAPRSTSYVVWVMDVESGAEWRVHRCHAEFAELWEVCTGLRPSLARLDFPPWLPDVKETPGMVEARRPRLESYLQRLCSLLYMGPLHPSSAHVAHLLQDFLGTSPRVETLERLQRSRPERELRQALQVRAWQVLRLPPLERAVAEFVRDACDGPVSRGKKAMSADAVLKKLTEVIEHLQYVVTEGCFEELRDMVRASARSAARSAANTGRDGFGGNTSTAAGGGSRPGSDPLSSRGQGAVGRGTGGRGEGKSDDHSELDKLEEEDEALELISGSVRRQVEAEVFVPIMGRLYELLRTEGPTARLEKAVGLGLEEARGKPQSFHGIPIRSISPSSWRSSVKLLRTVGSFTLPCDKLDALVAVAHDIPALYLAEHSGEKADHLGADDFLPIFIFVLVNSRVEGLAVQSAVLEALCDPKKMMGEAGFCIATLSAALQHLGPDTEERPRKGGAMASLLGRRK